MKNHNPIFPATVTNLDKAVKPKNSSSNSEKAGSIHDLRRCAVSSLLKVPPQYTNFNDKPRPPFRLQDHQVIHVANQDIEKTETGSARFVLVNGLSMSKILKMAKNWTNFQQNNENSEGQEDFPLKEMQDRQKRASL